MPHTQQTWYRRHRWWPSLFTRPPWTGQLIQAPKHLPIPDAATVTIDKRQQWGKYVKSRIPAAVDTAASVTHPPAHPPARMKTFWTLAKWNCSFDGAEHMVAVLNDPPTQPWARCTNQRGP